MFVYTLFEDIVNSKKSFEISKDLVFVFFGFNIIYFGFLLCNLRRSFHSFVVHIDRFLYQIRISILMQDIILFFHFFED